MPDADVFAAVACPTRRKIIELLAAGERPVGDLVEHLQIRQPSVSEQLRVLRDAGLVQSRSAGRQRLYSLNAEKIKPVADWATTFSRFWDRKLDALAAHLAKKAAAPPPMRARDFRRCAIRETVYSQLHFTISIPMATTVRKEVFLPHSPDDVWLAITTPEAIAEWLMPNDFKPVVGHKFRLQVDGFWRFSGINECEVLEVDPPRRLVFNWVVVPSDPAAKRHEPMVLTWTLTPVEGGTQLVLEQTGIENIHWFYRFSMTMGWSRYLKSPLPKVLANIKHGAFTPGAVPLKKRCYTTKRIPDHLTR